MAIDPNSVVDFLRQKRLKATLEARRGLWQAFFPGPYTGTATQNTQLLTELRRADAIARLSLLSPALHTPGDDVTCRLNCTGTKSIKNPITEAAQTEANGIVTLGPITQAGLYPFIIDDGLTFSSLTLMARDHPSGDLEVARISIDGEWTSVPASVTTLPALMQRFFNSLKILNAAPEPYFRKYLGETAGEQSISLMMDGLTVTVVSLIPTLQSVAVKTFTQAGLSFSAAFVGKLIDNLPLTAPHNFTPDERTQLKLIFVGIPTLINFGISVGTTHKTDPQLCKYVTGLTETVNLLKLEDNFRLDNEQLNMAVSMVWDATTKSAVLICEATKKPKP